MAKQKYVFNYNFKMVQAFVSASLSFKMATNKHNKKDVNTYERIGIEYFTWQIIITRKKRVLFLLVVFLLFT